MTYLIAILCSCFAILTYFGYKFYVYREKQKIQNKNIIQYQKARMREISESHKKTSIFREMAIDSIAKQKLIYDEKTKKYIRLTQINK